MKKIMYIILVLLLGSILLLGCGKKKDKEVSQNVLSKIKSEGVMKIGLDDSYPPMEFRNEKNNLVGFDIDLANEIGKKIGVKVEFVTTEWSGILLALESGKFDAIISSLSITEEREKNIGFTKPYVVGGLVVAIKKGNTSINKLEDLNGKVIGCQMGSTGHTAAKDMEKLKEVRPYNKITEAFSDLNIGRIDGVIMDAQVGGYYLSKNTDKFQVLDDKVNEGPIGIGIKKDNTELITTFDKIIEELKKDGTMSKLSLKWFGFDAYK